MKWFVAGVLAVMLAACTALSPQPTDCAFEIVIRRFPSHEELGRNKTDQFGRFSLTFIHSVSETPVRDDYRLMDGKIIQTSEVFETHGAGLPFSPEETGATRWEHVNGKFIIHMRRPIDRLIVRTDERYKNRLLISGKTVNLNQWEDQALEISAEPCSLESASRGEPGRKRPD